MSDTIQFKLGMQKNPIDLKNPREGGWYKNKVEKATLLAKEKMVGPIEKYVSQHNQYLTCISFF